MINHTIYIGLTGLVINLVIAVLLTLLFRAFKVPGGSDETRPHEFVSRPGTGPRGARFRSWPGRRTSADPGPGAGPAHPPPGPAPVSGSY